MGNFRALRGIWPFRFAEVSGISMSPTYEDGDVVLVRLFRERRENLPLAMTVLVERDEMPGIFYVKRIEKSHGGAFWVEGDNRDPSAQERMQDSRTWGYIGAHEVRGRVLFRVKRAR
jgi:phage repressor protein C with HTH and peptisase S24 domain